MDGPRTVPGAADGIVRTLASYGFEWDQEVVWQSRRRPVYEAALESLRVRGHLFPCGCTRREIADSSMARDGSRVYPGTCRSGLPPGREPRAWRLRVPGGITYFQDAIQGPQSENVAEATGDMVLLRADHQFAYQLAVVVDDAAAGVTHVVRGADLLDSTCRQIVLQRLLGYPQPSYAHLPVVVNRAGEKLSKQTLAKALDVTAVGADLVAALAFLGQSPPQNLVRASPQEIWQWAVAHWSLAQVPRCRSKGMPDSLS